MIPGGLVHKINKDLNSYLLKYDKQVGAYMM